MPSINFNNAEKVFYQGKEIKKIYALNQLVWEQKKTLNEMRGNFLSKVVNNGDTQIILNNYLMQIWGIPYDKIKAIKIGDKIYDVVFIEYRNNSNIVFYELSNNQRIDSVSIYGHSLSTPITLYYD